ncbi:SDR family oxidoreductase [Siccirubricoccus sp. G192]|uniref:SDR family NAD(P)-dependent oxidoreductase n=1 Tax=Siccirubricoccus sp. G192 TaxID=2849651 RepID=UPI001C2C16CA|nr:SDR family NAD(P)-dependent oxidoreductase [Siccirubricoccus sp. G192]MBV1797561.1 SDR family NAD(P)-dependent oxidoreductase [Siccirubricoccus sp. G192]
MTKPPASWPAAGRPAIVVTGASSGIGAELARVAAREGLDLVLVARSAPPMQALAAELRAGGMPAHVVPLDLASPTAPAALGAALAARGLHCEVLVNNAGYALLGPFAGLDAAAQLGIVDLNLRAATALALAALPGMLARGRGGVLNVGSTAGFLPGPNMAVYYASKAYLRSLSEALWAEARGSGVAISCLCPGPVRTPFLARAGIGRARLFRLLPKAAARQVAERGWRGFRRGRRIILPDPLSWLTARAVPLLPRALLLPLVRRWQRPR